MDMQGVLRKSHPIRIKKTTIALAGNYEISAWALILKVYSTGAVISAGALNDF